MPCILTRVQTLGPCRRRLTPQPIKVRADVEMTCFSYDGVEKIKEAMRVAQASGNDACPVSMKLVAAPRYVLTTSTLDKAQVGGAAWALPGLPDRSAAVSRRAVWLSMRCPPLIVFSLPLSRRSASNECALLAVCRASMC
jgi:hypothetical protein